MKLFGIHINLKLLKKNLMINFSTFDANKKIAETNKYQ